MLLRNATLYTLGLVFGAGLLLSGLTRPSVIIGALDFAGAWDPRMFVVVFTSIVVYLPARLLILRRAAPVLCPTFPGTPPQAIDARLVAGAAIFGLGWGLCGSCPGQSVTALLGSPKTMLFVASMLGGMGLLRAFDALLARRNHRGLTAAAQS